LSGKQAGTSWGVRRFPVHLGRSPAANLRLEEPGVWDRHVELDLATGEGFFVTAHANALITIDGQPVQRKVLRNGDTLELGGLRIQFWLARTRQSGLRFREWLIWSMIGAVSLAQIALVYWVLRA
jgi:hypothetical protein